MRKARLAIMVAIGAAWAAAPVSAQAANCLQKFSCQIGGECRLPCLDDLLGNRAAAPRPDGAGLDTRPTASLAKPGAAAADARSPTKEAARPKLARRDTARHRPAPVHIVAARDIASLAQLAGKPVSFGRTGDPAQVAGRKLFARLGIKVAETPLDLDNALDGLATGDIAAVLVARPRDVAKVKGARDTHVLATPEGAVAQGG